MGEATALDAATGVACVPAAVRRAWRRCACAFPRPCGSPRPAPAGRDAPATGGWGVVAGVDVTAAGTVAACVAAAGVIAAGVAAAAGVVAAGVTAAGVVVVGFAVGVAVTVTVGMDTRTVGRGTRVGVFGTDAAIPVVVERSAWCAECLRARSGNGSGLPGVAAAGPPTPSYRSPRSVLRCWGSSASGWPEPRSP